MQAFHVLAGSSSNVGAGEIETLARRLEGLARDGELAVCRDGVGELEREWEGLAAELGFGTRPAARRSDAADVGMDSGNTCCQWAQLDKIAADRTAIN